MTILAWNCRGLDKTFTSKELRKLVRSCSPNFIFLCETLIPKNRTVKKLKSLGFFNCEIMIGDEAPRGLALAWRSSINASIHFILPFAICVCWKINNDLRVYLVGVYLSNLIQIRSRQFEKITSELLGISDPIACFGDFNALCSFEEKEGGNPINRRSLADFNAFINDLRLIDIGFTGPAFTWSNKHVDHTIIYERLDRFLLNDPWIRQWLESLVDHKDSSSSDHRPIILFSVPPSAPIKRFFGLIIDGLNTQRLVI
ncbi:hypothetical protein LINPERPRIM_LOCUS24921 [Linum perenne]